MTRKEYIEFMETNGFPHNEAEKMADFALMDFDSYEEAYGYYFHSPKFWRCMVYAGHRKARRPFRKEESTLKERRVLVSLAPVSYTANALTNRNKVVKKRSRPSGNTTSPPEVQLRLKRLL